MAGDQHVGFTDCEGFRVQFLPEELHADALVQILHLHLGDGEHATRARSGVVDLANDTRAGQGFLIVDQEKGHDQSDYFARGVVFPGSFIGDLREATDQILEQVAHFDVGHLVQVQVDLGEAVKNLEEQPRVVQALELVGEQELVEEDVTHIR